LIVQILYKHPWNIWFILIAITLLPQEEQDQLTHLKEKLLALKALNKHYAKLVLSVSEFYNSLLERMVPVEMHGYQKVTPKHRSLLEVHA